MKRISLWFFILVATAAAARAQDAETTERLNKLDSYVQELQATQLEQEKHIQALEKEIADLRDKLNQPGANNYASADDLQKLAAQVQELAKKQQADNDQIVKTLEKLGKISSPPTGGHRPLPSTATPPPPDNPAPAANSTQTGFYYEIKSGNTLSAIAKAYRDQGIKVTADQILSANPGLDPKNLVVGKKIFIPAPAP